MMNTLFPELKTENGKVDSSSTLEDYINAAISLSDSYEIKSSGGRTEINVRLKNGDTIKFNYQVNDKPNTTLLDTPLIREK